MAKRAQMSELLGRLGELNEPTCLDHLGGWFGSSKPEGGSSKPEGPRRTEIRRGTFNDGNGVYTGELEVDGFGHTRKGRGRMVYRNGDIYEGNWEHNQRNGLGHMQYSFSGGPVRGETIKAEYDGEWKDDQRSGKGTLRWTDAAISKKLSDYKEWAGDWLIDKMNGEGVKTKANGVTYKSQWRDSVQQGENEYGDAAEAFLEQYGRDCFLKNGRKDFQR